MCLIMCADVQLIHSSLDLWRSRECHLRIEMSLSLGDETHKQQDITMPMPLSIRPCLYTTKIVRGLFDASIGLVLDSFACSFNRYLGRVYVTSKAICFFSQMFGFEKKFVLWLMDTDLISSTRKTSVLVRIRQQKETPRVNHAVTIQTNKDEEEDEGSSSSHYKFFMDDAEDADGARSSEEEESLNVRTNTHTYIFRKVQDRDKLVYLVRLLISRLHSTDSHDQHEPFQGNITSEHCNSGDLEPMKDPSNATVYYEPLKDATSPNRDPNPGISISMQKPLRLSYRRRRLSRSRSVTPYRHVLTDSMSHSTFDMLPERNTFRQRVWSEWSPEHASTNVEEVVDPVLLFKNSITETSSNVTYNQLEDHFNKKKKIFFNLEQVAIPCHTLPNCSISNFFSWFLSDTAIYPIQPFLTQIIGDINVHSSSWSDVSRPSRDFFEKTRQFTFDHRLSSSIGPSHAATTRTQHVTFYGSKIVMEEKTQISGAPAADCFHVETIWLIEATSTSSTVDPGGIDIQVRFDIHFTKSTFLKGIISSMTRSETQHWFQAYMSMIRDACLEQEQGQKNKMSDIVAINDHQKDNSSSLRIDQNQKDMKIDIRNRRISSESWIWILLSTLTLVLITYLYFLHSVFMKVNVLEKEILRLNRECIV